LNKQNNYLLINKLYFNENIPTFTLFRKLMFKANPFNFEAELPYPIINKLPSGLTKIVRVIRLCFKFFIKKSFFRNKKLISLDHFGHVLLKRQLNDISIDKSVYKIFNFNKEQIISQYDSSVLKEEMLLDIKKINTVKNLNITPKLLKMDNEKKYYIEEYLNLKHPNSEQWDQSLALVKVFIKELYVNFPQKIVSKKSFINSIDYNIDKDIKENPLFTGKINRILKYIELKTQQLYNFDLENIIYTQSHGDLNKTNFFLDNNRIIGIDWELLDYRSMYYDVFYFILIVNRKDFGFANKDILEESTKNTIEYLNKHFIPIQTVNKIDMEFYLNCFVLTYLNWKLRVYLTYTNEDDFNRRLSELLKDVYFFENIGNKLISTF